MEILLMELNERITGAIKEKNDMAGLHTSAKSQTSLYFTSWTTRFVDCFPG